MSEQHKSSGYVLVRTSDGLTVAKPGCEKSYTGDPRQMCVYATREAAEAERCVESEVVVPLYVLFGS